MRPRLAPLLRRLKRGIWGLLRFYTYRLWSQQNQVDGLIVTAIEGLDEKYAEKIKTLEGTMAASPGDWIIRGVSGEHYPCKPDIFEATYDRVD